MNQLRLWLDTATTNEKKELAARAGTSIGTLSQIAGGYRNNGDANVRSGLAGKLERAAAQLRRINPRLPQLLRTDLSLECRECEFAQRCLGQKAALSGFPVVDDMPPVEKDREGEISLGLPKFDRGV